MPVNDWEDSWYDDPLPPRDRRGRGGVVAVAVVTFVMCGFNALSSMCFLFCGFVFAAAGAGGNGNGLNMPGNLLNPAVVTLAIGLGSGLSFLLQIIAGVGLANSSRWARNLSFYLAGYSAALMACFLVFLIVSEFTLDGGNPEQTMLIVVLCAALFFHLAYAVVTFWVLLNAEVARNFR